MNMRAQITEITSDDESAHFKKGLKAEIKAKLSLLTADTLKELIMQTSRMEATGSLCEQVDSQVQTQRSFITNEAVNRLETGLNQLTTDKCRFCKRPGHSEKFCFRKKRRWRGRRRNFSKADNDTEAVNIIIKSQPKLRHRALEGILNDKKVSILIDSGATYSFINNKFNDHSLKICQLHKPVRVSEACGKQHLISTKVSASISLGPVSFDVFLYPLLLANYDVILGMDWLSSKNPLICWSTGQITVKKK